MILIYTPCYQACNSGVSCFYSDVNPNLTTSSFTIKTQTPLLTEGTVNFYINGVIQTKLSKVGNWSSFKVYPTSIEDFGLFNISTTITTKGVRRYLDDFRIYSRLLTTDEISRFIGSTKKTIISL